MIVEDASRTCAPAGYRSGWSSAASSFGTRFTPGCAQHGVVLNNLFPHRRQLRETRHETCPSCCSRQTLTRVWSGNLNTTPLRNEKKVCAIGISIYRRYFGPKRPLSAITISAGPHRYPGLSLEVPFRCIHIPGHTISMLRGLQAATSAE